MRPRRVPAAPRRPARRRPRRVVWAAAAAAVAVVSAAAAAFLPWRGPAAAVAAEDIVTVQRGTVTVTRAAAGTVQAARTRGLSFAIAGTVTQIAVRAGDSVSTGEVLARIDDSAASDAVSAAESDVASAAQALADAQASASSASRTATAGACLAAAYQAGSAPSASPSAEPSAAPPPTAPGTPVTSAPVPSRSSTGAGTAGGGACAVTQGGGTRAGSGSDSLYSAQQKYNNAALALVEAQRNLAGTVITAPVAGRVLSVSGTVGTAESPGSTAFLTIGSTADSQVQAQFSEADVAGLAVGQPASITLASRTGGFTGTVSQISPAGTVSGQLVRYTVMIGLDKAPADLLYGQSANVVVTTGSAAGVLYVPSAAVDGTAGASATVTVRQAGRDERRTVQVGLRGDQYTEIRSGLVEGDRLVVPGGH